MALRSLDLMIGDWVFIKDYPIKALPQKVRPEHFVRSLVEFEPIPLTPEILEKNGFVEWRDKCYRWEYAEGIFINADFTEEEPWAHISNRCYSATPVCRYVHELQHALRLCGIGKEIVL